MADAAEEFCEGNLVKGLWDFGVCVSHHVDMDGADFGGGCSCLIVERLDVDSDGDDEAVHVVANAIRNGVNFPDRSVNERFEFVEVESAVADQLSK